MQVKDIMSTKVEFITPTTSAKDAAHLMHETHVGVLPVLDDGKVVGIVTDRDIDSRRRAAGRDGHRPAQ